MAVAWGHVRGRVVFDSSREQGVREQQAAGLSWTGTRSLLVTDWPAVYVHDSGGIGKPPVVTALDPARDHEAGLALVDSSTRLVADILLPQGRSVQLATGPLRGQVLAALTGLRGRLLPEGDDADFVSPCAVSVVPHHEDGDSAAEVCAYVLLAGGRLQLRSRGNVLFEWPANRIVVTPYGPSAVEVRGGAPYGGRFLSGATLHLITPQVRDAFLAATRRTPARAVVGSSAPVEIRGLGAGQPVKADCVLGDTTLELQSADTQKVLAAFDLGDPQLRIAGSAERFVVFSPAHGPVSVSGVSAAFGRRLQKNAKVRACAERTLTSGVLPAELADGRPVAFAFAPDGVRVRGPEVSLAIAYDTIRSVEGDLTGDRPVLRLTTRRTDLTVAAQPELVQALHTEIKAGGYGLATPEHLPGLLRAAVGLEEDYLLYTIFGPFYELHAVLAGLSEPVVLPDGAEERSRTAAVLQIGIGELQRHVAQVVHVLPAFVRSRDARLVGGEPAWLKAGESALRSALAPLQRVAGETAQLAAQLSRLVDLDPDALPKVSYAGAAVSLGAAALVNPIFAVSGLSQAYSARTQGEQSKARLTAQSERTWSAVLERWNALVESSLPVLAYVVTENVFPLRWAAARRIAEQLPPTGVRAVARRLAALDVMRAYPSASGVRLRRGEIADHLRERRDALATPRFADF